jgi:hypothetical protein
MFLDQCVRSMPGIDVTHQLTSGLCSISAKGQHDCTLLAMSLLAQYNMWRDMMGMTDESSKRNISVFASS